MECLAILSALALLVTILEKLPKALCHLAEGLRFFWRVLTITLRSIWVGGRTALLEWRKLWKCQASHYSTSTSPRQESSS